MLGHKEKEVPFWLEMRKLVNETEVGLSNNYTGRHLAVQLRSRLAAGSVVPTDTEERSLPVELFSLVPPISSGFEE